MERRHHFLMVVCIVFLTSFICAAADELDVRDIEPALNGLGEIGSAAMAPNPRCSANPLAKSSLQPLPEQLFCSRTLEDIQKSFLDERNQMSFGNSRGRLNIGVCWWHSRFQRAAGYLAVYRPDLPKPSRKQMRKIIEDLMAMRVVEIPGYSNLSDFSADQEKQIRDALGRWQIRDGLFRNAITRSLKGRAAPKPDLLRKTMDDLYDKVHNQHWVMYQRLKTSGMESHSWLVTEMKKIRGGYVLSVLESNHPDSVSHILYLDGYGSFPAKGAGGLKATIDELYEWFGGEVPYHILVSSPSAPDVQHPVIKIEKTANGYQLIGKSGVLNTIKSGQTFDLNPNNFDNAVIAKEHFPYTSESIDLERILKSIRKYCKEKGVVPFPLVDPTIQVPSK